MRVTNFLVITFLFLNNVAISITSCSQGDIIADAAAVLKHSIHLSSYPSNKQSKYNYQMVAFVHPEATACIPPLQILNYEIHIKDTPIDVSQIRGDFLRENVQQTGCCGEKEYLKLYAYTLVNYKIVVHLDLDSLILQPLDDLFDSMLLDGVDKKISDSKIPVMHGNHVPEKVEAYFTRDYNMANLGKQYINIQGGFLVIRPNLQYFEEYKEAILEGDFRKGAGWKNKYGGYFGAQQIQGLCSYFFDGLHPGTAVELNRCYYNAMNDNPRKARRKDNVEICRDNRDNCEDCRETDFSKIKSVHFTLCQKPWTCPIYLVKRPGLCREYHKNWFRIRQDFERLENILEVSSEEMDTFRGNCKGPGNGNYIPINFTKN